MASRFLLWPILALIVLGLGACAQRDRAYSFSELVLKPGDEIVAKTLSGTVRIAAEGELTRTYTWEGDSCTVRLTPRKTRWYGGLGGYSPGDTMWRSHHGITRGVLEEMQMNFASLREAQAWVDSPWHRRAGAVYRNDGLFVLFHKTPQREQINIDVVQILVNHRPPSILVGASDDAIKLTR